MKTNHHTFFPYLLLFVVSMFFSNSLNAQYCDSTVPSFNVDLSASPNYNWLSPPVQRDGFCCGATNPDQCLEFIITLHPSAIAVSFNIASGAIPPGALFYQVDCGPITPVGDPICLEGPGPHHLTFCKPGNNENTFSIVSYSSPIIGPDITLNAGCQGFIYGNYYDESTINWTSVGPGAQGDYDYLLSCNSGCDTTYITAPTSAPAYVDYMVCGMDVGGCNPDPICDTIRVNFVEPVAVNISALETFLCAGSTTTLTANGSGGSAPYSYLWSTGATTSSIVVAPGTYYVEVVDTSNCYTATDTIVITQYAIPPVNAGPDVQVCEGTSITLSGSGAVSYAWDNGVLDGIPFIQAVGTITYTVTGTDANGCTATDQVDVVVNPTPIVNAGVDQVVCEGSSVTLSGAGAVAYLWDNGVTDGVAFTPAVGTLTYTVTGTDANGCLNTDQVDVTVNPLPIVNAGIDQVVCEGSSVTLSASGTVSYAWDNGVFNGVAFTSAVGTLTYTVTGTDANGCSNTDQVDIIVNALPLVNAGVDQIACEGSSVTLNAAGAVSYVWDNGVTDGIPFGQGVGTTTYTVIGTDANGCVNSDQVDVTMHPLPNVSAGSDQMVCEGVAVTLSGSGAVSYVWNNGVTDGVPFVQGVGTATYSVIGTDVNGCSSNDQVSVTVNPLPVVNAGSDQIICEGVSVTLNGSGAVSYAWDNGVINGVPFTPAAGSVVYTVTGTDANGCSSSDQATIFVNVLPTVNAGPDQVVCEGTPVTLTGSGAVDYIWTNGVLNGVAFVQGVGTASYTVVGTDLNGCFDSDDVLVTVDPNPIVFAGVDQSACEGTSVTLSAIGSPNLYWENGIINNVPFTQAVGVQTYIVHDSLSTGCTYQDTLTVEIMSSPIVTAPDVEICEGEGVTLEGQGANSYLWTGGIWDGVEFYPTTSGIYTVIGTAVNGCTAQVDALVTVHPSPIADFKIDQLSLTTADPTTSFTNLSIGGVTFDWDFGDGSPNSSVFEPTHTFPTEESGEYEITLTVYSDRGCPAQKTKYIHVFQDYTIYVPNSFTPDGDGANDIFAPVMEGFDEDEYTLYIFNRWGDLIFESHVMGEGWNGTFKDPNAAVQDGAYTWKVIAGLKDSTDSKIFVGHVVLLK